MSGTVARQWAAIMLGAACKVKLLAGQAFTALFFCNFLEDSSMYYRRSTKLDHRHSLPFAESAAHATTYHQITSAGTQEIAGKDFSSLKCQK